MRDCSSATNVRSNVHSSVKCDEILSLLRSLDDVLGLHNRSRNSERLIFTLAGNRFGEQASVTPFSRLSINRRSNIAETRPRVVNQRKEAAVIVTREVAGSSMNITNSVSPSHLPPPCLWRRIFRYIPRTSYDSTRARDLYTRFHSERQAAHDNASSH